jgi:hypothetical protein
MHPASFAIFIFLQALIVLMACLALRDGYFSMGQMQPRPGKKRAVFVEHGGMWGNTILISPAVAVMVDIGFKHWSASVMIGSAIISLIITAFLLWLWAAASEYLDEAFARDEKLTLAGWFNGLYVWTTLTIIMTFYRSAPEELLMGTKATLITSALMVYVVIGVILPDLITHKTVRPRSLVITITTWALILKGWLF